MTEWAVVKVAVSKVERINKDGRNYVYLPRIDLIEVFEDMTEAENKAIMLTEDSDYDHILIEVT